MLFFLILLSLAIRSFQQVKDIAMVTSLKEIQVNKIIQNYIVLLSGSFSVDMQQLEKQRFSENQPKKQQNFY